MTSTRHRRVIQTCVIRVSYSITVCSSASSALNSTAAVTWEDIIKPRLPGMLQKNATIICKLLGTARLLLLVITYYLYYVFQLRKLLSHLQTLAFKRLSNLQTNAFKRLSNLQTNAFKRLSNLQTLAFKRLSNLQTLAFKGCLTSKPVPSNGCLTSKPFR